MANFGLNEKPYIKSAGCFDVCYVCYKNKCAEGENPYDAQTYLTGQLEDQDVFFIRRSGVDTCICKDCFSDLYNDIFKETSNTETQKEDEDIQVTISLEEPNIDTEDKKAKKRGKNNAKSEDI